MSVGFWSPKAEQVLKRHGRQDVVDRGDALAQRVTALVLTCSQRLNQWAERGHLYENRAGESELMNPNLVEDLEQFVNVRLRQEIEALENLLSVFDDIDSR
jgi:hypothetical protein